MPGTVEILNTEGISSKGYNPQQLNLLQKHKLTSYLQSKNLTLQPFRFEPTGLQAWSSRSYDKITREN